MRLAEGWLFWTWPPEARSALFPAVPAGPSDVRPPGPWPVALATSVISRPLPARLTPSGLALRARGGGGVGGDWAGSG